MSRSCISLNAEHFHLPCKAIFEIYIYIFRFVFMYRQFVCRLWVLHPEELGLTVSKSNRLYLVFLSLFSSICLIIYCFSFYKSKAIWFALVFSNRSHAFFMLFSPRAPPRMSNVMSVPIHVRPNRHPEY